MLEQKSSSPTEDNSKILKKNLLGTKRGGLIFVHVMQSAVNKVTITRFLINECLPLFLSSDKHI
jgi:hypothetical protein